MAFEASESASRLVQARKILDRFRVDGASFCALRRSSSPLYSANAPFLFVKSSFCTLSSPSSSYRLRRGNMASVIFANVFANAGAIATVTGFASTALLYAGKKAFALEKEVSPEQSTKTSAPSTRKFGLSIAPQFDGLNCFETMVFK